MSPLALCVVCVSERRDVVNMSSLYYGSIPASTFIMDILQIKVASDTSSGVVMCNRCNSSLNNFYKFYKMVRDAQHKYNEMKLQLQDEICFVNVKPEVSSIEDMKEEYLDDEEETNEFKPYPLEITYISEPKQETKVTNVEAENSKNCHEMSGEIIREAPTLEADFIPRSERATTAVFEKYKVEDIYSNRKWKISEEEKDEIFQLYIDMKCTECETVFPTYKQLNDHCMTDHGTNAVVFCDNDSVPSYEHMERHILYEHILNRKPPRPKKRIPCNVCNKLVLSYQMKAHLSTHLPYDKREFQCDQCPSGFGTKKVLLKHIASSHSKLIFICPDCGKSFKSQRTLDFHVKALHRDKTKGYLCPDCGKRIKSKRYFELHVNEHRGIVEKVKCPECDAIVKAISYERHKSVHKQEQCPDCTYKGTRLSQHNCEDHKKTKSYACSYCPMKFIKKGAMEDHAAARHTGIPRYTCEFCSKTFMSSGNHHSHLKKMHPEQLAEKRLKMAATSSNDNSIILEAKMLQKRKYAEGAEVDVVIQNIQSEKQKKKRNK